MTLVLEESEDFSLELILCLLDSVKSDNKVNLNSGYLLVLLTRTISLI